MLYNVYTFIFCIEQTVASATVVIYPVRMLAIVQRPTQWRIFIPTELYI